MRSNIELPNIYEFVDHLDFIDSTKKRLEACGYKLSFQDLAQELGVKSRTKMKRMLKGDIRFPKETMERLGGFLELSPSQFKFLNMLRVFNESDDAEKALSFYGKIIEMRKKHLPDPKMHELGEVQYRLLEKWYHLPILSYLGLEGASHDAFAIVKAFRGQLSLEEVADSINILVQIKLIKYSETGELLKNHSSVSLLDGLPRPLVKKFHLQMLEKASWSVNGMPQEKRHLMSSTLTIKEEMLPEIKETIVKFVLKLHNDYALDNGNSLYQINTQLFSLARV